MKRIAVTGGTGFLGHALWREMAADYFVHSLGTQDYDLTRREQIYEMLERRYDAVIHLAAVVGGIGANRKAPGEFFYKNAIMGIELLEACRVAGVEKVVVAGTVCAYPKYTPLPFREADLWEGYPEETNAPYGLAKRMLLVQAQAYRKQYGMNIIYLLPTNLYGPGDNFDLESGHVIPSMIRKFMEARNSGALTVELWGDGRPTREFLYVDDGARAFRLALEHYNSGEPVNIGAGTEISIFDLAHLIRALVGYTGDIKWISTMPNGQPRRKLSTMWAETFGFKALVPLEEGLARTINWYEENLAT